MNTTDRQAKAAERKAHKAKMAELRAIAQHTPGPWFARERTCKRHAPGDPECYIGPDVMVRTKQDLPVAQCYGAPHRSINQTSANARLIAAAPEMWRILRETMDGHDATARDANFRMCGCSVCHYARPLLAKIDGGPDGG